VNDLIMPVVGQRTLPGARDLESSGVVHGPQDGDPALPATTGVGVRDAGEPHGWMFQIPIIPMSSCSTMWQWNTVLPA
jgi:hypothetical protein